MNRGRDRRSPAQCAYEIIASEDGAHDYQEWRDLTPEVQMAFIQKVKSLLEQDQKEQEGGF